MKRVESNTGLTPKKCRDTDVGHEDNHGSIYACIRKATGTYNIIVTATGAYADWPRADLLAEGELMLMKNSQVST